ncbi:MAG: TetR/AcrR family transcriptional regulator, partial [Nevskiales bacterium]
LYQALSAAAVNDPRIEAVVQRASERGFQFLNDCYRALGLSAHDARQWAMMAYSVYLGTLQLRRDQPESLPAGADYQDYVKFLTTTLLPAERPVPGVKTA